MKTKKQKNSDFKKRVKETVNLIYNNTVNEPQTDGFAKYRKNTLFTLCGSALRTMGIVENVGNKTKPQYVWTEGEPETWMINRVMDLVREKRNGYGQKKSVVKTEPAIIPAVVMPTPQPVLALVNFTDQQIWDELKSRGYVITDGRLCKPNFLN